MDFKAFYLVFLILFMACNDETNCLKNAGENKTEYRVLKDFISIDVGEKFEITLLQDTNQEAFAEVICGENIIDGIETKVENGVLKLRNLNKCNFLRSTDIRPKVRINVNQLKDIYITGNAKLFCEDTIHVGFAEFSLFSSTTSDCNLCLATQTINFNLQNAAHINLYGTAQRAYVDLYHVSSINCLEFEVEEMLPTTFSRRDSYINAKVKIFAKIHNTGNLFYKAKSGLEAELFIDEGEGKLQEI